MYPLWLFCITLFGIPTTESQVVYLSPGKTGSTQGTAGALTPISNFAQESLNSHAAQEDTHSNLEDEVTMEPPSIDCGEDLDVSMEGNGTITSPGYPDNYPAFLNCKWTIKAMPGKKILAKFSEFDITANTDCSSDYIIVNTGSESNRYCGKFAPSEIESDSELLEIEFHTNQGDSCRGFSLDYTVVTKQVSCGTISSDVQFEFKSPNYPQPLENKTMQCDLTISHDCKTPICQLRLDMLDFRLGPPTAGDCNNDQFIVRANEPLPVLCGNNSRQHLYVDVRGRKETNLNILSMPILPKPVGVKNESDESRVIIEWLHEVDPDRAWNILVTQIPCSCEDSPLPDPPAPTGCLQYYKEVTGVISSFNYNGRIRNYEPCWNGTEKDCGSTVYTGHLNNLDYSICIRSQPGYCGIAYSQVDQNSFQLTGLQDLNIPTPVNGESNCFDDFVYIPRGSHPEDSMQKYTKERYCGQILGNTLASSVISYSKPFMLHMTTDSEEPHSGIAQNNRGFQLRYSQLPCSLSKESASAFL
ncbi:uncharacterized protein LOC111705865 [Eurytemora carolleeae]|uniref:uncharacterized protein LOC111705865 n=1 Tax=Eurytemora carolleeae TaxID=1294199 RepID=UPI000C761350|nr:uncharacterized protein LOC111705865 [Eurytemora carolleeae]|eukprot:XP_023334329.1 uncharacterized protein LOC111705865 [Eurytemora affinis]